MAELESQFKNAVDDKEAAIKESERCALKLQLANRLITALASEGECGCIKLYACSLLWDEAKYKA